MSEQYTECQASNLIQLPLHHSITSTIYIDLHQAGDATLRRTLRYGSLADIGVTNATVHGKEH